MMKEYHHNSARNQSISSEIKKFGRITRRQEPGDETKKMQRRKEHMSLSVRRKFQKLQPLINKCKEQK